MSLPEKSLVSIIMNCYDGEKYLREALDSVYSQTYQNWEIIFWDNNSTDNSALIAQSYDERLKYFLVKKTTSLGEARVNATKKATGDYLAFLDSDDLWEKEKLLKQMNLFDNSDRKLGFVYGRAEVIFNSEKNNKFIFKDGHLLHEGDIFGELVKENFVVFSSVVVDREKFWFCGGFPKHFKNSTDYWIFLHMAKKYPVRAIQDVCCKYRLHDSNLSLSQRVLGAKEAIEVVSLFFPDQRAVDGLKYQYVQLAIECIKEKKIITALVLLFNNGGWWKVLQRLIEKMVRSFSIMMRR